METMADGANVRENKKRYDYFGRQISTLATAVGQMVDINIAHTQAGKDLGAGKEGGVHIMTLCQKKDYTNESSSPPKRKCHLCRKCYKDFMKDKNQTDLPLIAKNVTKIL